MCKPLTTAKPSAHYRIIRLNLLINATNVYNDIGRLKLSKGHLLMDGFCLTQVGAIKSCSATTAVTHRTDLTQENSYQKTLTQTSVLTSSLRSLTSSRAPSSRPAAGMTLRMEKTPVIYNFVPTGLLLHYITLELFRVA